MKPMLPEFGQCGELFHTPAGTAFADIPVKHHRETWPLRQQAVSELVAGGAITNQRGRRRARRRSARRWISWKRARNSMAGSAPSTSGPPSTPDASSRARPRPRAVQTSQSPNAAAPVRTLSREQRELMIAANNSYLLAAASAVRQLSTDAAIDIWPAFS